MIRWLVLLLAVLAAISLFIGDATLAPPDALILWQLRAACASLWPCVLAAR